MNEDNVQRQDSGGWRNRSRDLSSKKTLRWIAILITIAVLSYVLWRIVLVEITSWRSAVGILLVTYSVIVLVWKLPRWQISKWQHKINSDATIEIKDYIAAENSARSTLAQILGGVFVFTGLYFTAVGLKNSSNTLELSRQGQITDRYTKALQQISNKDQPDIVIGGIYALGRIPKESPSDHWPIMEVLTAYVRRASPLDRQSSGCDITETPTSVLSRAVRPDVQAVMNVLKQRNLEYEKELGEHLNLEFSDLSRVNLRGVYLAEALFDSSILKGANFDDGAVLKNSSFQYTNLTYASFTNAKLQGAVFANVKCLKGTDFTGADLTSASFRDALYLLDTNFTNAVLTDVDFTNLDLSRAVGLKTEQLKSAKTSGATLPASLQ
jgi:uncharacterized protein YjbI with pentapeptide repeats